MNSIDSGSVAPVTISTGDVMAFLTLGQEGAAAPASAPVVVPGMTNAGGTAPTTGAAGTAPVSGAPQGAPAGAWIMPVMLLGMLVLMIGMTAWSSRKQKKQRDAMMSALRKGDKVITGGGVIGHIVDMTDDEVVLRVEEGRIRFSKSAIQGAIGGNKGATVTETKEAGKTVNA